MVVPRFLKILSSRRNIVAGHRTVPIHDMRLENLPDFKMKRRSVILDIDADYFMLANIAGDGWIPSADMMIDGKLTRISFGGYEGEAVAQGKVEAVLQADIDNFALQLKARNIRPAVITIAKSPVVYTPEMYVEFIADKLTESLRSTLDVTSSPLREPLLYPYSSKPSKQEAQLPQMLVYLTTRGKKDENSNPEVSVQWVGEVLHDVAPEIRGMARERLGVLKEDWIAFLTLLEGAPPALETELIITPRTPTPPLNENHSSYAELSSNKKYLSWSAARKELPRNFRYAIFYWLIAGSRVESRPDISERMLTYFTQRPAIFHAAEDALNRQEIQADPDWASSLHRLTEVFTKREAIIRIVVNFLNANPDHVVSENSINNLISTIARNEEEEFSDALYELAAFTRSDNEEATLRLWGKLVDVMLDRNTLITDISTIMEAEEEGVVEEKGACVDNRALHEALRQLGAADNRTANTAETIIKKLGRGALEGLRAELGKLEQQKIAGHGRLDPIKTRRMQRVKEIISELNAKYRTSSSSPLSAPFPYQYVLGRAVFSVLNKRSDRVPARIMKFFRFVLSPRLAASRAISFIARYCVTALRFLGIDIIRYHLFIDLRANLLYLREGTKIIKTYRVSTGKATTPTPTGVFMIKTKSRGYLPLYSRFTNKVIWPNEKIYPLGKGYLGGLDRRFAIHSVRVTDAIGQYNSNGCIRLSNQDMQDLLHFARVGVSVVITDAPASSPLGDSEHLAAMWREYWSLSLTYGMTSSYSHRKDDRLNAWVIKMIHTHGQWNPGGLDIVEIGAGGLRLSNRLAGEHRTNTITAIDFADVVKAGARHHPKVKVLIDDAQTLAKIPNNSVDVVIMKFVLEYLSSKEDAQEAIRRVLRPDGLILSIIHHPESPLVAAAEAIRSEIEAADKAGAYITDGQKIAGEISDLMLKEGWGFRSQGDIERFFIESGLRLVEPIAVSRYTYRGKPFAYKVIATPVSSSPLTQGPRKESFVFSYQGRDIAYQIVERRGIKSKGVEILYLRGPCIKKLGFGQHPLVGIFLDEIERFVDEDVCPYLSSVKNPFSAHLPAPENMQKGQLDNLLLARQFAKGKGYLTRDEIARLVIEYAIDHELEHFRLWDGSLMNELTVDFNLIKKGQFPYLATAMLISTLVTHLDTAEADRMIKKLAQEFLQKKLPEAYDVAIVLRSVGLAILKDAGIAKRQKNNGASSPFGLLDIAGGIALPIFILTIHELSHFVAAKRMGLKPVFRIVNSWNDGSGNLSRIAVLQSSLPTIYFQVYIGENPDIYKETLCRLAGVAVDFIFLAAAVFIGIFASISELHKIFITGITTYNMLANFSRHEADNRQLCADATFIFRFGRFRRPPEGVPSHITPVNIATHRIEVSSSPLASDAIARRKFTGIILKSLFTVEDDIAFHDADALAREMLEGYRRSGLSAQEALRCLAILAPTYKGKSAAIIEELCIKLHTELLWQAVRGLNYPAFLTEKKLLEQQYGFTIFTVFNEAFSLVSRGTWENRDKDGRITDPLADEDRKYLPFIYWSGIDRHFDKSEIDDLGICITELWTDILKHVPQGMGVVLVRMRRDEKGNVLAECQMIDNGEGYDIEKYMAIGETSDFPEESQEVKANPDAHLLIEAGRGKSIVSCLAPDFIIRSQDKMFIQEERPEARQVFGATEEIVGKLSTGLPCVKGTQKIFRIWSSKKEENPVVSSSPVSPGFIRRLFTIFVLSLPLGTPILVGLDVNSVYAQSEIGNISLPSLLKEKLVLYTLPKDTTVKQLAKQFNMTEDLIKELNGLTANQLKAGQVVKVIELTYRIMINRKEKKLYFETSDGKLIKGYSIAVGKSNKTPLGTFRITSRVARKPYWVDPNDRNFKIPYGDPDYPYGKLGIFLSIGGKYGIHSTSHPKSIGKAASFGCIRVGDNDILEIYKLVPNNTEVTITDDYAPKGSSSPLQTDNKSIVIALGGNAFRKEGQSREANGDDIDRLELENISEFAPALVDLIEEGHKLIFVHGNGPQSGDVLNAGIANSTVEANAYTEFDLGAKIKQSLVEEILRRNSLKDSGLENNIRYILTYVEVSPQSLSKEPTKPIGPWLAETGKDAMLAAYPERIYKKLRENANGKEWRWVVLSPEPQDIAMAVSIKDMFAKGLLLICCGGGGIPVVRESLHSIRPVLGVIDKDLAAQVLARILGAKTLVILTNVANACINFGKPGQQALGMITDSEAQHYIEENHFGKGSMLEKVKAGIKHVQEGGEVAVITSINYLKEALEGRAGTIIMPAGETSSPLTIKIISIKDALRKISLRFHKNGIAVVGLGKWAAKAVLPNLVKLYPHIPLWLVEPRRNNGAWQSVRHIYADHPNVIINSSLNDILGNRRIRAVVVSTRSRDSHAILAEQLLHDDKHVFVEKPLSGEAAERLAAIAAEKRLVAATGLQLMYHPHVSEFKQIAQGLIHNGKLGRIIDIEALLLNTNSTVDDSMNAFDNLGVHVLSILQAVFNIDNAHEVRIVSDIKEALERMHVRFTFEKSLSHRMHAIPILVKVDNRYAGNKNSRLVTVKGERGQCSLDLTQRTVSIEYRNIPQRMLPQHQLEPDFYKETIFLEQQGDALASALDAFVKAATPEPAHLVNSIDNTLWIWQVSSAIHRTLQEASSSPLRSVDNLRPQAAPNRGWRVAVYALAAWVFLANIAYAQDQAGEVASDNFVIYAWTIIAAIVLSFAITFTRRLVATFWRERKQRKATETARRKAIMEAFVPDEEIKGIRSITFKTLKKPVREVPEGTSGIEQYLPYLLVQARVAASVTGRKAHSHLDFVRIYLLEQAGATARGTLEQVTSKLGYTLRVRNAEEEREEARAMDIREDMVLGPLPQALDLWASFDIVESTESLNSPVQFGMCSIGTYAQQSREQQKPMAPTRGSFYLIKFMLSPQLASARINLAKPLAYNYEELARVKYMQSRQKRFTDFLTRIFGRRSKARVKAILRNIGFSPEKIPYTKIVFGMLARPRHKPWFEKLVELGVRVETKNYDEALSIAKKQG
ncbi:MAG: L,D-transpeptidase family protein, partial [Candidatus Omnitrophica bacterium]|nr:L,D-transpeptidase family protein [Candidatus Omnitrophota bacterium]